jgi:hypothetical protein
MAKLSIRRNWSAYAEILLDDKAPAFSKGGRASSRTLAHGAFYAGARSTLQVLAFILERGDIEQLHRTIASQGRQINVITGLAPRKRRHCGQRQLDFPGVLPQLRWLPVCLIMKVTGPIRVFEFPSAINTGLPELRSAA